MQPEINPFLQQLSNDLAALSQRALQSLVQVRADRRGIGAGTVVRSSGQAGGLIVTNAHVVAGQRGRGAIDHVASIEVRLADGREGVASIVAIDTEHDLAALHVDLPNLVPIPFAQKSQLVPGTMVMALGFPWGVSGGLTSGIVIDMGAGEPALAAAGHDWLAASLHLRPGHSGGPMVDTSGQLVGINTLMTGPDVGIAVPVHLVAQFLATIDHRSHTSHSSQVVMV